MLLSSLTQGKGSYLFLHSIYQYLNLTNVTEPVRTFFFSSPTCLTVEKLEESFCLSFGVQLDSIATVLTDGHRREANIFRERCLVQQVGTGCEDKPALHFMYKIPKFLA